jgi:hypothetical protein
MVCLGTEVAGLIKLAKSSLLLIGKPSKLLIGLGNTI